MARPGRFGRVGTQGFYRSSRAGIKESKEDIDLEPHYRTCLEEREVIKLKQQFGQQCTTCVCAS